MSLYEYEDISSSGNYKPGISDISILPDLSSTNDTPLHVAVKTMNLNMVSLLLKDKKCNVNALATGDLTPLHLGARTGNELIFNMLLQAGANIRAQDQNGWTCLHYGAFYGNYEIVEIILTHASGLLNVIDNAHHTALHLACRMGLLKIIIKLLEQGAALDIVDNAQNIPTDYLPPIVPSSDSIIEKNPEILSLQTLGQNMRMLFQSPDHSDLEFFLYDVNNDSNSPPHIFRSHRAIIQFRCPSLLETGPNRAYEGTNRIIIRNIPLNVFQAVLEYVYCGVITFINDEIDLEFALTLSKKGEELKMLSLTQYCENLICSLIPDSENDAETVLTVLETAKSTPRVVNYCRYLILKNLNKFMKFVSSNIEFSQTFTSHLLAFLKIVNIEAPGAIPRIALTNKDTAPSLTFDLRDQPKDPILINDTINKISSKHIQEMTKNSNKKPSRIPPTAGIINSPYDGTIASSGYVMSPDGNNNSGIHPDYERTIIGTTPNYVNQQQLQQQKQQQLQQKQLQQQQHLQQQQQQQQLQQQQHIHHHHHQKQQQQQQQQRAKYVKNYGNADLLQGPLLDAVLNIMKELFSKVPQVEDFITPVNYIVLGFPDYPDVVGRPMDLTTISKNLENKNYKTLREWALDVRRVWDNARVYNQSECNIHQSADQLSKIFEGRYMELQNNAVDLDTDYDPTPEEMNFYEAYIKGLNRYRIRSGQLPLEIPKNNQEYPCPADKYNVNHNAKPSGIKKTQQKPIGPKKRTRNAMEMTQNLQGLQHNLIPPGSIIHNTGSITMNNPMNPLPSPMPPNIDVSMAPRNSANMIPNPNQTPPPNPNNDPMNSLNGNQKLPFSPDEWAEIEQLILNLDPESSHQVVQILGIRPNESGEFFIQSGEISLTKYLQLKKYLATVKPRTILNGSHA